MSSNPQKNTTSTSEVRPRFSVAIPTYCRTEYLQRLLDDLMAQTASVKLSEYEILVCDNSAEKSAEPVVKSLKSSKFSNVVYTSTGQNSIAEARNRLLESARGEAIIFVDDDQRVEPGFLQSVETFWVSWKGRMGGAKFRVQAQYVLEKPRWFRRGGFFSWPIPPEGGDVIRLSTNGCLFDMNKIKGLSFTQRKSCSILSPGEDLDFSLRLKKAGERIVSAPSILVYEVIPPARETVAYLLQRDFHRAQPYGEFLRRGDFGGSVLVNLSVCLGKLGLSFVAVPLSIFLGPIFFLRTVLLFLRQLGKLVGFLQFTPEEG